MKSNYFVLLITLLPLIKANAEITIFEDKHHNLLTNMVIVDSRKLQDCIALSVKKSKCLPAEMFQSKNGVLASFRDIYWVFGASTIKHTNGVLVFGDNPQQRNALAGLFHLAGQKNVWIWPNNFKEIVKQLGQGVGSEREQVRSTFYSGEMRDKLIVLTKELAYMKKNNWTIVSTEKNQAIKDSKLIAYKNSPLDSIALFVDLMLSGYRNVKVVVD
ncbi:MAG: hypothetical protein VCA13_08070 [PS1 clade bacterium]|jgi:hypothetical protein|tara:strand:- start:99 stop:746 length:648 start_codon:yes stop_codon:yes gene_type:complete